MREYKNLLSFGRVSRKNFPAVSTRDDVWLTWIDDMY